MKHLFQEESASRKDDLHPEYKRIFIAAFIILRGIKNRTIKQEHDFIKHNRLNLKNNQKGILEAKNTNIENVKLNNK